MTTFPSAAGLDESGLPLDSAAKLHHGIIGGCHKVEAPLDAQSEDSVA